MAELAGRFHDPLLREALTSLWAPDFAALFMFTTLGFMYKKQAGCPMGGSLPVALSLEKRYEQLGGQIHYRARVGKILVEKDRAVGVRFEDGSEERADVVVSAADGYATVFKLDGRDMAGPSEDRVRCARSHAPTILMDVARFMGRGQGSRETRRI